MLKLCRKYLHWIQNSVFEGEISEVKLKELVQKANGFMDKTEDSIILFKHPSQIVMEKEVIGDERSSTDVFLWNCNVDVAKRGDATCEILFCFFWIYLKYNMLGRMSIPWHFLIIWHRQFYPIVFLNFVCPTIWEPVIFFVVW